MSAPPGADPNGAANPQKPAAPRPKKKKANPLVARSTKPPLKLGQGSTSTRPPRAPTQNGAKPTHGGWSDPPPATYKDIPIKTTKKALLAGIRYHLMKFHQAKPDDPAIDPSDQDEFTRPVTLHRRDARQPAPGRTVKDEDEAEDAPPDEAEAEKQAQLRADREAQRAEDLSKIAPVAKDAAPKKPRKQKEERTIFSKAPKTEAARKESDLRYEEALPWHLEDADGKNVWVGSYEAALSESNVAFVIDGSVFRMVPVEKWYKFTSKSRFQAYSIEEAEAMLAKKFRPGRWVMKGEQDKLAARELADTRRTLYGSGSMIKTESATFKAASRQEKMEHDDLDFNDDDMFQDDDEAMHFEQQVDEDTKEAQDRIRREQLGANTFGEGDEQEVDKELLEQLQEEQQRKKFGKSTKKALVKRDREDIYASDDSDEKPWSSSSEDSSSDEDEDKDEKKDSEPKDGQDKDKAKSLNAKGNTTPQGKQRLGDAIKNKKSLKRAGSPNLSESSGNESSRKKKLKKNRDASGARVGTPLGSAALARRAKGGAGSGSDGEATAGEMSDGASRLKKKTKLGATGTPSMSRAGSPSAPGGQRSASPSSPGGATIEAWEILEHIPAEGITISDLIQPFSGRVGDRPGQMPRTEWIKMVRGLCNYGPDKKLTRR